jgi:hypothetical protein
MNDHLINSSLPSTQIIAALKAEDGTSQTALNAAAAAAEQRWPLLKSLTPQKWAIAPTLTADEKTNRNMLGPVDTVIRKPAASAPNINAQLASALNRMNPVKTKPKAVVVQAITPPPVPTPAIEKPAAVAPTVAPAVAPAMAPITVARTTLPPAPTPPLASAQPESNAQSESIQAVLHRIEQAHLPAQTERTKVPGFLARLGKR